MKVTRGMQLKGTPGKECRGNPTYLVGTYLHISEMFQGVISLYLTYQPPTIGTYSGNMAL
jgi:hypothetical protein